MTTTFSGSINAGLASVSVSHEISNKIYPKFMTIADATQKAIHDSPGCSLDKALHGLLIATYEGEFKEKLFGDNPQPTESEKEMTDLAKLVQSGALPEEKRVAAVDELYQAYYNQVGSEPTDEEGLLRFFASNLWWKGFSSKKIGTTVIPETANEELRPLASEVVMDELLLGYLSSYEHIFQELFPKLSRDIKTFADLKRAFPNEFQHFLRISPSDYRIGDNYLNAAKTFASNPPQNSLFLQEFKKMKISGATFKSWLKRFLNGDFDR